MIGLLLLHAILIVIEILTLQSNHVVSLLSQGLLVRPANLLQLFTLLKILSIHQIVVYLEIVSHLLRGMVEHGTFLPIGLVWLGRHIEKVMGLEHLLVEELGLLKRTTPIVVIELVIKSEQVAFFLGVESGRSRGPILVL